MLGLTIITIVQNAIVETSLEERANGAKSLTANENQSAIRPAAPPPVILVNITLLRKERTGFRATKQNSTSQILHTLPSSF